MSNENMGVKDTIGIVLTKADGSIFTINKENKPLITEKMLLEMLECEKSGR